MKRRPTLFAVIAWCFADVVYASATGAEPWTPSAAVMVAECIPAGQIPKRWPQQGVIDGGTYEWTVTRDERTLRVHWRVKGTRPGAREDGLALTVREPGPAGQPRSPSAMLHWDIQSNGQWQSSRSDRPGWHAEDTACRVVRTADGWSGSLSIPWTTLVTVESLTAFRCQLVPLQKFTTTPTTSDAWITVVKSAAASSTLEAPRRNPVTVAVALEELAPMPPKEERARDQMIGSEGAAVQRLALQAGSRDEFLTRVLERYASVPPEQAMALEIPQRVMSWYPDRERMKRVFIWRAQRPAGFPERLGQLTEAEYRVYTEGLLANFTEDTVKARRRPSMLVAQGKMTAVQLSLLWNAWNARYPAPTGDQASQVVLEALRRQQQASADRGAVRGAQVLKDMRLVLEAASREAWRIALHREDRLAEKISWGVRSAPGVDSTLTVSRWKDHTYQEAVDMMSDEEFMALRRSLMETLLESQRSQAFQQAMAAEGGADPYLPTSPWLGTVTADTSAGVMIVSLEAYSPAVKAGLHKGDVLMQWGETPIADRDALHQCIDRASTGRPLKLLVKREGKIMPFMVTLEAL